MVGAAIDILSAAAIEVDRVGDSAGDIQRAGSDCVSTGDAEDRISGQLKGGAIERDVE